MKDGIFLLLGSNEGDPLKNLQAARTLIASDIGRIVASSSIYKTAAWGNRDQPDFYNQVLRITTEKSPEALLQLVLQAENKMGRERVKKWGPRIIDIDILFFDQVTIHTDALTVPHPAIAQRRFTLVPLAEIAPEFIHPVLHKNISTLLAACADPLAVEPIAESK
jgi:2-amino-4-hydroxy-6-hydroxymethyldihydropteridine diphosphokinase